MPDNSFANYSLLWLPERAALAREEHADYLHRCETSYHLRAMRRIALGIKVLCFGGMGRAGKDTAAEYVCAKFGLGYPGSSSNLILPLVAHMIGIAPERAWTERHDNRVFWIKACHAIRGDDVTMIGRMCLSQGDVIVGPRGELEFAQLKEKKIVDWTIWIENPRVPADVTVEFAADDCDLMVSNASSKGAFYAKLDKIIPVLLHA